MQRLSTSFVQYVHDTPVRGGYFHRAFFIVIVNMFTLKGYRQIILKLLSLPLHWASLHTPCMST